MTRFLRLDYRVPHLVGMNEVSAIAHALDKAEKLKNAFSDPDSHKRLEALKVLGQLPVELEKLKAVKIEIDDVRVHVSYHT